MRAVRTPRTTTARVRVVDAISRWVITIGGLATVVSVLGVFVFLLVVVLPLLRPADWGAWEALPPGTLPPGAVAIAMDESRMLAVGMGGDAAWSVAPVRQPVTTPLRFMPLEGRAVTAVCWDPIQGTALAGLRDGAIATIRISGRTEWQGIGAAPEGLAGLAVGGELWDGTGVWRRVETDRAVRWWFAMELAELAPPAVTSAVRQIDFVSGPDGFVQVALHEDGTLEAVRLRQRRNMLTGRVSLTRAVVPIAWTPPPGRGAPTFVGLSGLGDALLMLWPDGWLQRYDVRDAERAHLAEELDVLPEPERRVTAARFLLGRSTLLVGDSGGRIALWFAAPVEGDATGARRMVSPRHFQMAGRTAVTTLAVSSRSRMFAAGSADGRIAIWHATSGKRLGDLQVPGGGPLEAIAFSPKEDALIAGGGGRACMVAMRPGHPEVSLRALFGRVWYEGASRPAHVWQSSSGTDDFEPKFGLMPLVFGTVKATVVAMVLAAPLALLAALYSSEFMRARWRAVVKPTIELMAALPSVVLGFLAALVIAPWVAANLPAVIASFGTVPLALVAGGHLWALLPRGVQLAGARVRPLAMATMAMLGFAVAGPAGRACERWLFAGDVMRWLDGQIGGPWGGWAVILLPLALAGSVFVVGPRWDSAVARLRVSSETAVAVLELFKFLGMLVIAAALSAGAAALLTLAGADPRGGLVGTYVQRNALVVGVVMGFAIIPIIYTIADDALISVPEHLRSASLAAGATPWQTAVRIVAPAAAGGIFSAVMVGLGRAVGETMIVLMAAGNTPIMSWNVFNGFRTLSANIAVELPEAVRNSTHYRTLFLASLVLFLMTFVVNTVAEAVRLRVRRRLREL
ncbi:MAG: ABC transporter permease subunit [Kiritimatiellae bacterium]|nr:ABC transporter permease subunit [Kiritimatiellia bacterium]